MTGIGIFVVVGYVTLRGMPDAANQRTADLRTLDKALLAAQATVDARQHSITVANYQKQAEPELLASAGASVAAPAAALPGDGRSRGLVGRAGAGLRAGPHAPHCADGLFPRAAARRDFHRVTDVVLAIEYEASVV
jgi:hypothetical protein